MKRIINILFNTSLFLLLFLVNMVLFTSLLWLLKIPMSILNFIMSFLVACISMLILNNKKIKLGLLSIIFGICFLVISILVSGYVYDQSDDGNSYHKETIGMIRKGWNPIYDDYNEFGDKNNLLTEHELWAVHYPKTTWIIGSSVYTLTNNIETAKFYNILICFIAFGLFLEFLFSMFNNKICCLITTILIILNPIIACQIFSFYIDGFLEILLFITCMGMYKYIFNDKDINNKLLLGCSIILIVNCKFTGLAYAGIFCLGFYLYYVVTKIKNKKFIDIRNSIVYFIIIVILAIVLVGSNSYIKNVIENHNPFYPLAGEGKVDIMTYLQPASFKTMSPLKKNFYSIFSRSANIGVFNNGEPELKIPFTYDSYEVSQITYDTRIGGYGVLFSGIFIISIIIILLYIISSIIKHEYNNLFLLFVPLLIIVLLVFFLSDGWWARYSPYLYLVVIISLFILLSSNKLAFHLFFLGYCIIILLNSSFSFLNIIKRDIPSSGFSRMTLESLNDSSINICMSSNRFTGILYNLEDYNIHYKITECGEDKKKLYGDFVYYFR